MRALILAVAVLLAASVLWWFGQVETSVPPGKVDPVDRVAGENGLIKPLGAGSEEAQLALDGGSNAAGADGRVEALPGTPGRAKGHQQEVVVTAPAEFATEAPEVYTLESAKARLRGRQRSLELQSFGRGAKDLWRWERAVSGGTRVQRLPDWSQDADGAAAELRVHVPKLPRGSRVLARLGSRVALGVVRSSWGGAPVVIDFAKPTEVISQVSVRHADGRPAEGIAITSTATGRFALVGPSRIKPMSLPLTNASGEVQCFVPTGRVPAAVVFGIPPLASGDDASTHIHLPPVGAIEVTLEAQPGRLPKRLSFGLARPAWVDEALPYTLPVVDGRLMIEPVALGQRFRLSVDSPAMKASADIDGPTKPGEIVQMTLSRALTPQIRFKLEDEAGDEVVSRRLMVLINDETYSSRRATTGPNGVMECFLLGVEVGTVLERIVVHEGVYSRRPSHARIAKKLMDKPLVAGVMDLGTLVLRPPPLLVSGRVVDGQGKPIKDAVVRLATEGPYAAKPEELSTLSTPPGNRALAYDQTDPSGFFQLRQEGDATEGGQRRLALVAGYRGAELFEPVEFAPGATGVELVLEEGGKLTVDLSALDSSEMQGMEIMLDSAHPRHKTQDLSPGHEITMGRLRPGLYAVKLELSTETAFLAEDLEVQTGKTLVDPRLNPVSLKGVVQWRTLYVTGPSGAPLDEIIVGEKRGGIVTRTTRIKKRDGAFRLAAFLHTPPEDYWIEAKGCRRRLLESLDDRMSIELQGPIQVSLQLVGTALPTASFALEAISSGSSGTRIKFDVAGHARASLPGPGLYRVAKVQSGRARAASPPSTEPWWGATFTVPEEGGLIEIRAAAAGR